MASKFCCLSLSCDFVAASVNLSLISVKNQIAHRSHNNAVRGHYDSRRSRAVKMVNGTVAKLKTDLTVKFVFPSKNGRLVCSALKLVSW